MIKVIRREDKIVGANVRRYRRLARLSQTKLGDAIGLTFQQVQKYETGANRISCSKLCDISKALSVPVVDFFDGIEALKPKPKALQIEMLARRLYILTRVK